MVYMLPKFHWDIEIFSGTNHPLLCPKLLTSKKALSRIFNLQVCFFDHIPHSDCILIKEVQETLNCIEVSWFPCS